VGTQLQWRMMPEKMARFFLCQQMEQGECEWANTGEVDPAASAVTPVPVQMRWVNPNRSRVVVDLVAMKACTFPVARFRKTEIPGNLKSEAESLREKLVEMVAESTTLYWRNSLSRNAGRGSDSGKGFARGIAAGKLYPICSFSSRISEPFTA